MKKRVLSLILSIVMVLSMLPMSTFAADRDETQDQVRVIVENTKYSKADGAAWEGTLVDTWVNIDKDSTAATCVKAALEEKGYAQEGADSGYVDTINGLKAGVANDYAGWMFILNDWFADKALVAYTVADQSLEDGDEIRIVYSLDMGVDHGGVWGDNTKTLKALSFSEGTLAPAFASDTKEYTLTIPEVTESVVVTPTASNKNFQVRTTVGDTEYKRTDAIPVADGTVITVKCGDPSWPTMNNGEYGSGAEKVAAETYTITVKNEESGEEEPKADPCALTALEVAVGGNTIENAAVQTLSPAFESAKTEYSTPILDYESSSDNRFVMLKITAPEGATATAKCNDSEVATLVNGEWGVLQKKGGYFWAPTYSGPLSTGKYNEVIITVSAEGEEDKVYTVTIPMQPDTSKQSLSWKTNLSDAIYFEKDDADAALTVEAQYNNRPLENKEEITYQWYSNTTASTEGGTAIEGATAATYSPAVTELGTSYYYVVASCKDLDSITSNVITVTVTDESAPKSITVVCDYPYTIPNDWVKALGGKTYIANIGDTLQLKAIDENGKETPVDWPNTLGGGTIDDTSGIYTVTGTSYSYVQVTSLYDSSIKSEEKVIQVSSYAFSEYSKTPSVTLSTDGQTFNKISTASDIGNGYVLWNYKLSGDTIAELVTDLSTKSSRIEFTAMRPGTIEVSFDLDLDGDGKADGNGQTDSATMTINGIAVEDSDGKLTKTYLEISKDEPNPTMQMKALSSTENAAFTWTSADESVATVDENGKVTAKAVGSTIISAADGTYTGGIKVVVTDADVPYFEQIDFTTTYASGTGLSNASWETANFKPATLEYKGLALTKATASTLTFANTTLYNTEKYTAAATYTDVNGEKQSVNIESGKATALADIPFETSVITITLTDKTDDTKKTVYTFEITRPRDTTKAIANSNSGIVFVPDGRDLIKDKYNDKTEGTMYVANEDGSFAQYSGVSSARKYYRTYALDALESFTLNLKASTAFAHIRYSTDDGSTWTYLGQSGSTGLKSEKITIPARTEEAINPVVKVMIQILDDATYTANIKAEKDGFADAAPNTYTLWVEQIPKLNAKCDIVTAAADGADWYPTFAANRLSYRLVTEPGAEAPVLTYTVSAGAIVTIGDVTQTPDADGKYTLTLTNTSQAIVVTSSDGSTSKSYSFGYSERESDLVPNKVVDFLSINSQYTNGSTGGFGVEPQKTLTGGDVLSLGNFGGYITYYYENGLTDDPAHAYGVDFHITGNAFKDTSTGTGLGSMEPGQVWVSEDGSTWYALAGSEHYEDSTLWDYAVTYSKTETGGTAWTDNKGNTHETTHGRTFSWPSTDLYTMNDLPTKDSFTLSGILIPCVDGTIAGKDNFNSFSKGARFGYVDVLPNGTSNPYSDNSDYSNTSSGFDLAWAVDGNGIPVDVSNKEFHYVKVVTASNLMAGAANEKSTEVASVEKADVKEKEVGVTTAPTGVTISGGSDDVNIEFTENTQVYTAAVGSANYVSIKVNGTADDDNIYVNNQRVESGKAAEGIKVTEEKLVRIIVQNGEKEPVIYLLKLTDTADTENILIDGIKVDVYGTDNVAETKDGENYTLSVDYRIDKISLKPTTSSDVELLVNGKAVAEEYALNEGENTFTVKATKGDVTQTVTLVVTREKAPVSNKDITVYFELLGDDKHGTPTSATGTHTLASKNLKTWIKKTAYTVPDTATVLDVLILALDKAGLSYVNSGGNYISEINGLKEFSNGKYSGWMYTLNGTHPGNGVSEQSIKDGDYIIFHYTDDYTIEEGSSGYTGLPFTDVDADSWYIKAVSWAVENGITSGTSDTTFEPNKVCTRAEVVKFLQNAANEQASKNAKNPFTDVKSGAWYEGAVLWAVENKITSGTSATTFSPNKTCTRAEVVKFLHNVEGNEAPTTKTTPFNDVKSGSWYENAILWAVENKITSGTSATTFSPDKTCTRAEIVTFLYNYYQ